MSDIAFPEDKLGRVIESVERLQVRYEGGSDPHMILERVADLLHRVAQGDGLPLTDFEERFRSVFPFPKKEE